MKGVVTGGAGFVGAYVTQVLRELGHDVTVLDQRTHDPGPSVVADITDRRSLVSAFAGAEFVCHLAAVGDVYLALRDPVLTSQLNVVGTGTVCEAALESGAPTVVYASTWEVYGPAEYQPVDEAHPCHPDHPYGITKLAGEQLALSYSRYRNLRVIALRMGTAYGRGMRESSVFSRFLSKAKRREEITIDGGGGQRRQFVHARDLGKAFAAALTRGRTGEAYNTVGDEAVSIAELATMITDHFPARVLHGPSRVGEPPSVLISNARASAELGWRPQIRFADGIADLIEGSRLSEDRTSV